MGFLKVCSEPGGIKNQEMEPLLGRDDVRIISHRKKADLIDFCVVLFSAFLLEQTVIGHVHFWC